MNIDLNRRLSIAPMLDCTDRHERYFLRLISKHVLLYSEMVVTNALLHTSPEQFLGHEEFEYPAVLQLGGSTPADLAKCCKLVEAAGFQEVNLNCGCPSDRVQSGSFGACLMKDKNLVADCFKAMQDATSLPVSIKCRIGVDEFDSWDFFTNFTQTIADAGCRIFIIHARKAWLKGLSPKENREVPPLQYEFVHKLKAQMPQLNLSLNGGVKTLDQVLSHLNGDPTGATISADLPAGVALDGVMVGREAYENPWFLHDADQRIFGDTAEPRYRSRKEVLEAYLPYVEKQYAEGCPATILVKHIYGLFAGMPGARKYRQMLSEGAPKAQNYGGPAELIRRAMEMVVEG